MRLPATSKKDLDKLAAIDFQILDVKLINKNKEVVIRDILKVPNIVDFAFQVILRRFTLPGTRRKLPHVVYQKEQKSDSFEISNMKMAREKFKQVWEKNVLVSSKKRFLFGIRSDNAAGTIDMQSKSRFRFVSEGFRVAEFSACELRSDDATLFLGTDNGEIIFIDLKFWKLVKVGFYPLSGRVVRLKSSKGLIIARTANSHIIAHSNHYPFAFLFYQDLKMKLYRIVISERFFVTGGEKSKQVNIFRGDLSVKMINSRKKNKRNKWIRLY